MTRVTCKIARIQKSIEAESRCDVNARQRDLQRKRRVPLLESSDEEPVTMRDCAAFHVPAGRAATRSRVEKKDPHQRA